MARQKRKKRKLPFGAQYMSHDKYFYGKKLNIILALHSIYQKQKTESVYLILKNNYGLFSETHVSKIFSTATTKMMTSANICHHFEFFFYETEDYMLVIVHAKFEVNSCRGWDFRQGR